MTTPFICPICGEELSKEERLYRCEKGHCFDMAKEGYVNLLPANKKHSKDPGDDKDMVASRTLFLEGGHYEPLRKKVCSLIEKSHLANPVLLDSGCGEGYYTAAYCHEVKKLGGFAVGIDLSKSAIKHAAKKCKDGCFAVASVYGIPMKDESADIVVNCFSPLAIDEFRRILKKDGFFYYIVPDAGHLWELKSIIYDKPYPNEVKSEQYDGFELMQTVEVSNVFTLNSGEEILSLLHMTPYTWKTPKDGIERLEKLSSLTVTAQFRVLVYKRV